MTVFHIIKKPLLVALLLTPLASAIAKPVPETAQLEVSFALPTIDTTMYARPYVAVWVEDADRKPVRTMQLWVGKDEWLKDLRSWWRKVGRYDRELVDAVTSATRPAGEYTFVWDGLNDKGQRVEQGNYTFYVEVVREHGGRNYLRQKIELGENAFSHVIAPTEETGAIQLNYKL
ncbi:DUF2271 domain-containing protein [Photobacterium carnosum]|uniref:DUF2271 domain-containing protein n=1 Tax=Photobacterium carnosum TaxID=2023717 RepID=UPI001E53BAE3|nr:DUF2271 domain-containing protein [Photobacterium carnosum]MCD9551415.1 DUF2271 domain-containing protein [Photobacterium carnosum]